MAGPVAMTGPLAIARAEAARKAALAKQRQVGVWRPGTLRITLTSAPGLTGKGLLEEPFRFQVPPNDSLAVAASYDHSEYVTIGGYTLSRPSALGLRTVSFTAMFLDYDTTYAAHYEGSFGSPLPPMDPIRVSRELYELMESGTPFLLTIGQVDVWGTNDLVMNATLRTLSTEQRAGEPDTRYNDVAFSEFVRPHLLTRRGQTPNYAKDLPSWVTVYSDGHAVSGEGKHYGSADSPITLGGLAQRYYGSTGKWRAIAVAKQNAEIRSWGPSRGLHLVNPGSQTRVYLPKVKHAVSNK